VIRARDVEGARAVGIQAALLRRAGNGTPT